MTATPERAKTNAEHAHAMASRTYWLLLAFVVVLALTLRVWNYDYEIGRQFSYDTSDKIAQATRVSRGELTPVNWKQPYFLPYAGGLVLKLAGTIGTVDSSTAQRLLTLLMIVLGVSSVVLTERVASCVFANRWIGLLSALLLAVVPIHVVGSRYIKEDMPLVFFIQLSFLGLVRIVQRGAPRDYVLSGLAIGAAIGTKFSGVLLLPMLLLAHVLRAQDLKWASLVSWSAAASVGLVGVGFCLLNPYVPANLGAFAKGFLFQARYSSGAHYDGTLVSPWSHLWLFYLKRGLIPGLSWAVMLPCLVGLARLATDAECRKNRALVLLTSFALLSYVAVEHATAKPFPFFARYVLPMVPALCVLAAWMLWESRSLYIERLSKKITSALRGALIVTAVLWPLTQSAIITSALATDTRLTAARWIEEQLPRGASIALDDPIYSPHPSKQNFKLDYFGLESGRIYDESVEKLSASGFRYVVLNTFRTERFCVARKDSKEAERAHQFYESVRRESRLVHTIAPRFAFQSYGFHNPVIEIYELPAPKSQKAPDAAQ